MGAFKCALFSYVVSLTCLYSQIYYLCLRIPRSDMMTFTWFSIGLITQMTVEIHSKPRKLVWSTRYTDVSPVIAGLEGQLCFRFAPAFIAVK